MHLYRYIYIYILRFGSSVVSCSRHTIIQIMKRSRSLHDRDYGIGTAPRRSNIPHYIYVTDIVRPLPVTGYDAVKDMPDENDPALERLALSRHDPDAWLVAMLDAGSGDSSRANMSVIRKLRTLIWYQTRDVVHRSVKEHRFGSPHLFRIPDTWKYTYRQFREDLGWYGSRWGVEACVQVVAQDCLHAAHSQVENGKKVAVLNMASATSPGGGYKWGAGAQEENLHRRSDVFRFTDMHPDKHRLYPMSPDECLIHKDVTIIRGSEAGGYPWLDQPFQVTVISCAAVKNPELDWCGDYFDPLDPVRMSKKADIILGAAISSGCDTVIVSAFGCGAFGNPPQEVAKIWKEAISRVPRRTLHTIVFAIQEDHNASKQHNPQGNFLPFHECFASVG